MPRTLPTPLPPSRRCGLFMALFSLSLIVWMGHQWRGYLQWCFDQFGAVFISLLGLGV